VKKFIIKRKGKAMICSILSIALIPILLIGGAFALYYLKGMKNISAKDIADAEKIIGLNFTQKEGKMMLDNLKRNLSNYTTHSLLS